MAQLFAELALVLELAGAVVEARAVDARAGSYGVSCFHIAHITIASLRASATIAIRLPRLSAMPRAQTTIGSFGRVRHISHAAWTSIDFR